MPYCTPQDVKRIISTELTDDEINVEISLADAKITARGLSGLANNVLKEVSRFFTASQIAYRDPKSSALGDYKESLRDPTDYMKVAEDLINSVSRASSVKVSSYAVISE